MLKKRQLDDLYSCTCPTCKEKQIQAALEDVPNYGIDKTFLKLVEKLFKGQNIKKMQSRVSNNIATVLSKSVIDGYGKKFFQVAWNSPDREMIQHLEHNVYQFAHAKCHEQLKALTAALYAVDESGNKHLVPYGEFKDLAERIGQVHNQNYLRTEYNTAIGSAQMASRWTQFQSEKVTVQLLKYQTVGDSNVRATHRLLNGIVKPINDSFWQTYYPPNGWGCRCDVLQEISAKETPAEKIITPDDVPEMFKTNLAETGLVFPKSHPYFEHLPNDVLQVANGNNPFEYTRIYNSDNGGYVYDNSLHIKGAHTTAEITTAKILANAGHNVIFLPEINSNNKLQIELRKQVLPKDLHATKSNPDAYVDKKLVELKTNIGTLHSIDSALRKGKSQASIICIRFTEKVNNSVIKQALKNRAKNSKSISEVWILKKGETKPKIYTREMLNKI